MCYLFFFFFKWGHNWVIAFFFLSCLSLFCFNWVSFFNKGIWVNLCKFTFSIPFTFSLLIKQKREKLKIFFLSPYFFIFSPFSILTLFHPSNQTNPKYITFHFLIIILLYFISLWTLKQNLRLSPNKTN